MECCACMWVNTVSKKRVVSVFLMGEVQNKNRLDSKSYNLLKVVN